MIADAVVVRGDVLDADLLREDAPSSNAIHAGYRIPVFDDGRGQRLSARLGAPGTSSIARCTLMRAGAAVTEVDLVADRDADDDDGFGWFALAEAPSTRECRRDANWRPTN